MKCVICHGEDISRSSVNEEVTIEPDIVFVPVDVMVCGTCGERYYDRHTLRYLEDVERQLRAGIGELKDVGRVRVFSAGP